MSGNKLVEKRLNFYKKRTDDINKGTYKPIPFALKGLKAYVPGIIPGVMYKITSHTGMGKTQFTKYLILKAISYAIKSGVNFKVLYFAGEETRDEFIDTLIIYVIALKKKYVIDRSVLAGNVRALTQTELDDIEDACKTVELFLKYLTIVDDYCYKPTEIFDHCKKFAEKQGTFTTDAKGREIYTPNDPSQIVLVIYDHISLIKGEYDAVTGKSITDREAMGIWSTGMCKKILTKRWNWAVLNVQQQALDSEKQVFTNKGESVLNKVLPSIEGLADNKTIARDDYVIIGIFSPERYEFDDFKGYKVYGNTPEHFNNNFRSAHVLKNRLGNMGKPIALFFDGSYNNFLELPKPNDQINLSKFYPLIKK